MKKFMISHVNLGLAGGDGKLHITTTLANNQPAAKANIFLTEEDYKANKPYKQIDIPGTYEQDDPIIYCLAFPGTSSKSIGTISIQGAPQWIQMNDTGNKNCMINCTSMDLSILDTTWMTNLRHAFFGCAQLTSIDLNHFDTSKVTDMSLCFGACASATEIHVDKWSTSKVTNMESMFRACSSLQTTDLSNWDTSKVTDMSMMFLGCSKLTELKADNWDLGSLTKIKTDSGAVKGSMFDKCTALRTLNINNWNPKSLTSYADWFWPLISWTGTVDCSSWDTSKCTNISSMFRTTKLTSVNLSNWDMNANFNIGSMFQGCTALTSIDLTGWDLSKLGNIGTSFKNTPKLTQITIPFDGADNKIITQYVSDGHNKTNLTVIDSNTGKKYTYSNNQWTAA